MEGTFAGLMKEREELAERLRTLDAAIDEARERRRSELLKELEEPGVAARAPGARLPARAPSGARRRKQDAPCRVCGYRTVPPHDGRNHRGQDPKRPFSDAELAARGLSKG